MVYLVFLILKKANQLTYFGLHSLQHRGQEGAGIVSSDGTKLKQFRNKGLLAEVFANEADLDSLDGNAAIGHVRYATSGNDSINNLQPFYSTFMMMKLHWHTTVI